MISHPNFDGEPLSLWMATIEYTKDLNYRPLWEALLSAPGLRFVCLGFEEGVVVEDKYLTTESFPWNASQLVLGAIRQDTKGKWTIGRGPKYFET